MLVHFKRWSDSNNQDHHNNVSAVILLFWLKCPNYVHLNKYVNKYVNSTPSFHPLLPHTFNFPITQQIFSLKYK